MNAGVMKAAVYENSSDEEMGLLLAEMKTVGRSAQSRSGALPVLTLDDLRTTLDDYCCIRR